MPVHLINSGRVDLILLSNSFVSSAFHVIMVDPTVVTSTSASSSTTPDVEREILVGD